MKEQGPAARGSTAREALRQALLGPPVGAKELSSQVSLPEKEIAAHLEHLERSARARGERLVIEPAECLACNYVFRARRRFTTPGSCPTCRSERIAPPTFHLVAAAGGR